MNKKEIHKELERERKRNSRKNSNNVEVVMSIFDIHGKDYHRKTLNIFKQICKELKPSKLIFGGDEEDMAGISKYTAKSLNKGLKEAIEERKWFAKNIYIPIVESTGNADVEVYICLGNHNGQRVDDIIAKMREKGDDLTADKFEEK